MAKYNKKTIDAILELIKSDTYTIAEVCRQVEITQKTYHQWMNDHPEFAEAVNAAKEEDANVRHRSEEILVEEDSRL